MWIDIYCYFDVSDFDIDCDVIVVQVYVVGVNYIVVLVVVCWNFDMVWVLVYWYVGCSYVLGIYLIYVVQVSDDDLFELCCQIVVLMDDLCFVVVGEIGFDFFIFDYDVEWQIVVFCV